MNIDQLDRDAKEALASYPTGSSFVIDTTDVLKLVALAASHQRLKEALERIAAIEDRMVGGDWEEIEEARGIAREVLKDAP